MFRIHRIVLCALALCGVFMGGCSHGSTPSQPSGGESGEVNANSPSTQSTAVQGNPGPPQAQGGAWANYEATVNYAEQRGTVNVQATYKPNAVVFDQKATEAALQGVSADGIDYVFDAGSPEAARLKPGSVLFLYGIAVRKVLAVRRQGSAITAITDDADLTDLIQNGHITWKVPIEFDMLAAPPEATSVSLAPSVYDLFASRAAAEEQSENELPELPEYGAEGNVGPLDYDFSFLPDLVNQPHQLNMDLKAQLSAWHGVWRLEGSGYIRHFEADGDVQITNGAWDRIEVWFDGFDGHAVFEWTAEQQGKAPIPIIDQSMKVKLPYVIEIPMPLRGIPLVLELSAAILVHPAWTGPNDVARGKFVVDLKGKLGLSYTEQAPEMEGEVDQESETIDPSGTGIFGPNALGFVAALEFPRIEISLASMWPSAISKSRELFAAENATVNALSGKYVGTKAKWARQMQLIEDVASPVKPYAFVDVVEATGDFTNGAITSSLVGLPPCQRSQVTVTVNGGIGIKLNLLRHVPYAIVKKILKPFGHQMTFEAFEVAKPLYGPKTVYQWENGLKCPGDSSSG